MTFSSDPSSTLLRQAARALSSSLELDEALARTLRVALPALGDFGLLELRTDDGVRRCVAAPGDPGLEGRLQQLVADAAGPDPLPGRPPAGAPPGWRDAGPGDPPSTTVLSVPLRWRDELLGAMTLWMGPSGRRHDDDSVAAAADLLALAAPLVAHARLAARHAAALDAVRSGEERLRLALEAGELGIWDWDIAADRVTWSDQVHALHGMVPGDFGGTVGDFAALVHPDDQAEVRARLSAALQSGAVYIAEFRTVWPDGTVRWLSTRAFVQRGEDGQAVRLVGATLDVTARTELLHAERRARLQAERARQRIELLAATGERLSRTLEATASLDTLARALVPALADWCRIDLVDAEGRVQRAVTHHADPARVQDIAPLLDHLSASPETPGSMAWCLATGLSHTRNVISHESFADTGDPALAALARRIGLRATTVTPLVARGRRLGALAVWQAESGRGLDEDDAALVRELARRAALALDNARLFAEAQAARREAEDASRAKDRFLAMLGHELRNPLAPIASVLQLMARRDEATFREERRLIERQVSHLSRLVDDLLDVARITRGELFLKRAPLALRDVVEAALEMCAPRIEERGQHLALDLPDPSLRCEADADRLAQVFANLLTNAARYTPAGGHLAVSCLHDPVAREAHVVVSDDGAGLSPDVLPRVFELFYQGQPAPGHSGGGLGIGLALVHDLVAMHGGRVQAASDGPGRGSTFTVTLPTLDPATDAARPEPVGPATAPTAPTAPEGRGLRVLVVDDNRDAAETLTTLLGLMGHDVTMATRPEDGLALADAVDPARAYDLAILDIGLPGMDGHELARQLRDRPATARTRLVALSGYGQPEDRARSHAAGFDEHLVKPLDVGALERVLASTPGRRRHDPRGA